MVDSSGNKYTDQYNKNRYRIYIERYPTGVEDSAVDFYRIVVVLDSPDPSNLYLVYDKFEQNQDGIPFNQFLNYKEYINAVPAYSYVVEESEVIDPSSFNKRVYSTQLFAHKENKLLKNDTKDEGWKIVTPKKAVQDPRTFQNFNWRLLAKINYNFSKNKDIYENSERAVLKVAVLYSGIIDNIENPYVFANLEESVINQQNFLFENPLAPQGSTKSQRSYWALSIDDFVSTQINSGNLDAFTYDFLLWTPTKAITEAQKRIVDMFLANGVSVFIDCSNLDQQSLSTSGLTNFDFTLTSTSNKTGLIKIVDEYVNGEDTLNAWDLTSYNESSIQNYGIFGDRKNILNNNSVNEIRVFAGMPESADGSARSIAYIQDGSNSYSAILRDKYNSSSEFSAFSIFCLNPFLTYINDNYGGSGLPVSGKNKGVNNTFPVGRAGSQTGLLSEAVIGPNKMFYNIICESNRNKVNSRLQFSDDSTIVWNISPWRNSWTINGRPNSDGEVTVLFNDEKETFNFSHKSKEIEDTVTIQNNESVFCREIESSIGELLISDFEATSTEIDASTIINSDFSNVEFYLECTNDNVKFINFETIDNTNYLFADVKTSYSIHKISSAAKDKIKKSPLTLDAYSIVYSKQFDLNSIYYPYIILDYSDYYSKVNSIIKTPNEYLPGSQFVRDYDYAFNTQLFITEVKTNRYNYEVSWSTDFETSLSGSADSVNVITHKPIAAEPDGSFTTTYSSQDDSPIPISNVDSPFYQYRYPTSVFSATDILYRKFKDRTHSRNNFHYTNDIPRSKSWNEYKLGVSTNFSDTTVTDPYANRRDAQGRTGFGATSEITYDYSTVPPLSESSLNKEIIMRQVQNTWTYLRDQVWSDKLWWFKAKYDFMKSNVPYANPYINSVKSLYDHWLFFERTMINAVNSVPFGATYEVKSQILNAVYQSNTTGFATAVHPLITESADLTPSDYTYSKIFNVPAGTTGKQLFGIFFDKFLNSFDIFTPRVKETSTTNSNNLVTSGPSGNYVLYIQYTLQKNGIPVTINGKYDSQTANAVKQFQTKKKLNLIDSIVDSETKSVLAIYWINLYKYNRSKFETERDAAPKGVAPYINAAVVYSDIYNVFDGSQSTEYRRISYTGIPGPTLVTDHIILEVPQIVNESGNKMAWQELLSINLQAGAWGLGVKRVWMYEQDLGLGQPIVPEFDPKSVKASPQNIITLDKFLSSNESFAISLGAKRNIRYVMVEVYSKALSDGVHGPNAEGFSIKDVSFSIKTPVKGRDARKEKTATGSVEFNASAKGTISGKTNITSGDFGVFRLGSVSDANAYPGTTITSVNLSTLSISAEVEDENGDPILDEDGNKIKVEFTHSLSNPLIYSPSSGFNNDQISFDRDGVTYTIDGLSESTGLSGLDPNITGVIRTGGPTGAVTLNSSEVNSQFDILNNMAPIYQVVTTNGVEIESKEYSREYEVSNFYVADADSSGLNYKQNKKLSINAKDGAVVLTDSLGNPIGLPVYSEFAQPQDSSTGTSVEVSFGNTILKWNLKDSNGNLLPSPDGLQWGFYNIRTRQFLGKKFTYQYYMQNKRDVYIGLIAFDADRNSVTSENIIGIDNRTGTLREFQFPAKSLCPVYSVRVSDRPKIAISNPPKDLSKFDTWFINLSRGRFFKNHFISTNIVVTNWLKNYFNQTLRCLYDTTKIQIPSSGIFGSGYYDIYDENPIVISKNEIQLRHGSFHVEQEVLNKPNISTYYTDASPVEIWADVFIKDSNGEWVEVDSGQIRNYNKHTGLISFAKEIVPDKDSDIKVNYVVKNPNIILYQVNGKEIPLNPYVSNVNQSAFYDSAGDVVSFYSWIPAYLNKSSSNPIHFYILPSSVEIMENGEYKKVEEYQEPESVIDFTSDYSIFNPNSITYNPLAIYLGSAVVNNSYDRDRVSLIDLRLKGGGIKPFENKTKTIEEKPNILSFNDIYSGKGYLYPNGGYVIVKIPKEVKDNFNSIEEIYSIVRSNLTAGVAFDIQDMDGNDWRTI